MTRKEALREAVQIVASARIGKRRKAGILAGLALCQRELPFTRWSEEAIFDACDTWVQEHGKLCLRDFSSPLMPSHSAIQNRFGITARGFRDKYYPLAGASAGDRYRQRSAAKWNQAFREEFHRIRCRGQEDYNRRRDRELPAWRTLAAMNGVKTWRELLGKMDLTTYGKPRPEVQVRISGEDAP